MAWSVAIREALAENEGANYYKCALQVGSHSYISHRGENHGLTEDEYARQLLQVCLDEGIEVLGIADHFSVAGIERITQEAKEHGICVFPGFEAKSREGVHVLCLFDPQTPTEELSRYLGRLDVFEDGPSTDTSNYGFADILELVEQWGGVAIAAHVTLNGGLFRMLQGQACVKAWRDPRLLAAQIPASVSALPDTYKNIVMNRNPDYERPNPPSPDLALAVVNARDVARPEDLREAAASTFIKMDTPTIEGIRQAFLDPASRIRLASDSTPTDHAYFEAISWEGGFLDGLRIHFNKNLNTIIGGRGTGKSTIIESIRYVLDREPLGDEARQTHREILQQVVKSGTKVSLLLYSPHPASRSYLIERTYPNPPRVKEEDGTILGLAPEDILPHAEIYGQHEIGEVTRDTVRMTALLERFIPDNRNQEVQKSSVYRELVRNRQRLLEVADDMTELEARLSRLPELEHKLKRYEEAGLPNSLAEKQVLVREERLLDAARDRLAPFESLLDDMNNLVSTTESWLQADDIISLPGADILRETEGVFSKLASQTEELRTRMAALLAEARDRLQALRKRWTAEREEPVNAAFLEVLRELQTDRTAIDGEEVVRLQRELEGLQPLKEKNEALAKERHDLRERRQALLDEYQGLLRQSFNSIAQAAQSVSAQLKGQIKVMASFMANKEPLVGLLREKVGGRLHETIEKLCAQEDFSPLEFAQVAREGPSALRNSYGLTADQAERIYGAGEQLFMQIEELELPTTTSIALNVGSSENAVWRDMSQLSKGQKATAVMLLLLLESSQPLIVDQPEDDLDNSFIASGIVPLIRQAKRRRQFIFSTHNANIPVLGDAELILCLEAEGEADTGRATIPTEHRGSVDRDTVKGVVEEVLEGGKAAFETRRKKYGF